MLLKQLRDFDCGVACVASSFMLTMGVQGLTYEEARHAWCARVATVPSFWQPFLLAEYVVCRTLPATCPTSIWTPDLVQLCLLLFDRVHLYSSNCTSVTQSHAALPFYVDALDADTERLLALLPLLPSTEAQLNWTTLVEHVARPGCLAILLITVSPSQYLGHYVVLRDVTEDRDAFVLFDPCSSQPFTKTVAVTDLYAAWDVDGTDHDVILLG
mmetsp:Transcript_21/g.75  ORF Transcript_21/g.75 Transcript_21/m.75 type:complete len:214 (-) Transcript_21:578-1219(-)